VASVSDVALLGRLRNTAMKRNATERRPRKTRDSSPPTSLSALRPGLRHRQKFLAGHRIVPEAATGVRHVLCLKMCTALILFGSRWLRIIWTRKRIDAVPDQTIVFHGLLKRIPWGVFDRLVDEHNGANAEHDGPTHSIRAPTESVQNCTDKTDRGSIASKTMKRGQCSTKGRRFKVAQPLMCGSSCKTTFSNELWISRWPL
jgi:hypothetical protein